MHTPHPDQPNNPPPKQTQTPKTHACLLIARRPRGVAVPSCTRFPGLLSERQDWTSVQLSVHFILTDKMIKNHLS